MTHLCEYNYGKFVGSIVGQRVLFLQFSTENNGEIWRSFTDFFAKGLLLINKLLQKSRSFDVQW